RQKIPGLLNVRGFFMEQQLIFNQSPGVDDEKGLYAD
ncbi:MAG: hypothetical protein PWQ89_1273, partial [Verrucomicrobiota bacterium]|nr:hypothetical protein [Verrucomicrobiota bacterium]